MPHPTQVFESSGGADGAAGRRLALADISLYITAPRTHTEAIFTSPYGGALMSFGTATGPAPVCVMLANYHRATRAVAELSPGDMLPLDEASQNGPTN